MMGTNDKNLRILVVDDNRAIHEDFRKILADVAMGAGRAAVRYLDRYTVYLSTGEREDIEFVVKLWSERLDRRFSRSEVVRVAIRTLRAVVEELDESGPPRRIPFVGENRDRD